MTEGLLALMITAASDWSHYGGWGGRAFRGRRILSVTGQVALHLSEMRFSNRVAILHPSDLRVQSADGRHHDGLHVGSRLRAGAERHQSIDEHALSLALQRLVDALLRGAEDFF